MERVDKILRHSLFLSKLEIISYFEQDRKFCKHGIQHLLDVARIGSIILAQYNVDRNVNIHNIADEYMYAAALVHDLGRADEYEFGVPHEEAGAKTAAEILNDCGYSESEIEKIVSAVLFHKDVKCRDCNNYSLASVLYKADKLSRCCFMCQVREECKWEEIDKNNTVII